MNPTASGVLWGTYATGLLCLTVVAMVFGYGVLLLVGVVMVMIWQEMKIRTGPVFVVKKQQQVRGDDFL